MSTPLGRRLRSAAAIAACLVGGGCATEEYSYKLYSGPARADAELVRVGLDGSDEARIDGRRVVVLDYSTVTLLPGRHAISWVCEHRWESADVELEAGHLYLLRCDRTSQGTYQVLLDGTSGRILTGEARPGGPP